jgi:hypothetical protein
MSRSIPTSTAHGTRSSSQSISSSRRGPGIVEVGPDRADAIRVREREDVEQLGAGSGTEPVKPGWVLSFDPSEVNGIGR